ncbi:response regulator [Methanolobus sp. WCC5]|jgi:two-component system cell cycle response regulator DivK|uniref:response regulator n=1 Tax=Methanolobus sp. WCC5 TaxID=3125785 RepID=UPI003247F543
MACVLIVEDDALNAKLLGYIVESEGHRTAHAENGLVALDMVEKFGFDLIFMDIQMPEMDGLELMKALKERPETSEIPVIAVTACFSNHYDREFYLSSGFSEYIFKPVYVDRIKDLMKRFVESIGA